jgi:hypothetical protein
MRFPATLPMEEAPEFFDRFLRMIGPQPWQKRYRNLLEQVRANPLLGELVARRHGIELSIGRLLETHDAQGGLPADLDTPEDYAALSFITPVVWIYDSLSQAGKVRVDGVLRGGLNTHQGLRPFENEIETATHLMHADFDVTFWDLEGRPGFDFLAVRDGVELEVECKSISGDLGRQVPQRGLRELSDRVRRGLNGVPGGVTGGWLVRATLPARLPKDPAGLERVAANVKAALMGGAPPSPEVCETDVRAFDLAASPFPVPEPTDVTKEKVRGFVDEQLGLSNVSTFSLSAPGKGALVVVVTSRKPDRVIGELVRTLKDAAKGQFSRRRPAVLAVQFLELEAEDMLELARQDSHDPAKARALQRATSLFFESPGRAHMHTVVYRSHGTLTSTGLDVQERGPTYTFTNPAHPYAEDPRCRPFPIEAPEAAQASARSGPAPPASRASSLRAGTATTAGGAKKVGRNEPCPCGSGAKYKRCHGR